MRALTPPPTEARNTPIALRRRLLLTVLPCTGGCAVAVLILTNISLWLAAGAVALLGAGAARIALRRADAEQRAWLVQRARHGAIAGVAAVAAYDVIRYGIKAVASLSLSPFHAIAMFGEHFVGSDASTTAQYAVGGIYHLLTGVGFIVAYAIVFRRARWRTALAWATALEASALLLYPGWLGMQSVNEFAAVSIGGHFAFGTVAALSLNVLERRAAA